MCHNFILWFVRMCHKFVIIQAHTAICMVNCPVYSGRVEALCLDDPVCDVIIGNIPDAQPIELCPSHKDCEPQAAKCIFVKEARCSHKCDICRKQLSRRSYLQRHKHTSYIIGRRLCILFKDIICLQCVTTLIVHFSFTPRINITDSLARRTSSSYAATHCLRSHATRLRKTLALFIHGKSGPAQINVGRPKLYFVFTQHSVWAGLHRYVSALAVRPAHISYCIYTQLLGALYIFDHYTHAHGRTSDWCFSRQNVLESYT